MNRDSVKRNYLYNTIFQVLILIVPLITTPYVARRLTADGVGEYSFSYSIVSYFIIAATFGSSTYGQRNIAFFQNEPKKRSESFWNVFSFRLITSLVATFAYLIQLFLTHRVNTLNIILILYIIDVAFDITWFFQGVENFKLVVIRNLAIKVIGMAAIFLLVKDSKSTWLYALILTLSTFLGNLSVWTILPRYVSKPVSVHPFEDIKDMALIFLPTIAIQIYAVLDKSMIGLITGSSYQNGCYEQAEKIARMALTLVTSIGTVLLPRIANLYHENKDDEVKSYMYKSIGYTWALSVPIMLGIYSIADVFIPLFLGNGYDDAVILLKIFSALVIFVSMANTVGKAFLIPIKKQKIYTIAVTVAAVINLVMNLILIPKLYAVGAAIASIAAEGIGCAIQIVYCCKKEGFRANKVFLPLKNYLIAGIIMTVSVYLIKNNMSPTFMTLIFMVVIGIVTYVGTLICIKDPIVKSIKNSFVRKTTKA